MEAKQAANRGGAPRKWVDQPSARQAHVLESLGGLGARRATLVERRAYMTSAGRRKYDQVILDIRRQITRGVALGLGHEQMRDRVGVASSAYYKITGGRTGPEA